jgi:hypothetical protein
LTFVHAALDEVSTDLERVFGLEVVNFWKNTRLALLGYLMLKVNHLQQK